MSKPSSTNHSFFYAPTSRHSESGITIDPSTGQPTLQGFSLVKPGLRILDYPKKESHWHLYTNDKSTIRVETDKFGSRLDKGSQNTVNDLGYALTVKLCEEDSAGTLIEALEDKGSFLAFPDPTAPGTTEFFQLHHMDEGEKSAAGESDKGGDEV